MKRFWGVGAALTASLVLARNLRPFLKVALGWAILHTVALIGYCGYVWLRDWPYVVFDIGGTLYILRQPDQFAVQYAVTVLPDLLASLAVAIWWTRFVLFGSLPTRWINVPRGTARFLSRELLLAMVGIVAAVPGLLLARLTSTAFEQPMENAVAFAVVALDAVIVLYGCARFWLIFPAIAVGDDHVRFGESLRLTRKAGIGLLLGLAVTYLVFEVPDILITTAQDHLPLYGRVADAIAVIASILSSLFILGGTAVGAAVSAELYRQRVLESGPLNT